MRILVITQEPPFDPTQLATGNAIRTQQLLSSLSSGGHECRQVWLAANRERQADSFRNADELLGLLRAWQPGVVLVSYWELLQLLPFELETPVVLDFVAPRPLEVLFEAPGHTGRHLRSLRLALARADLLLLGNAQQEQLLSYWLLEAGMDLKQGSRCLVVPLAGRPVPRSADALDPRKHGYTLVAGGVDWPWRQSAPYLRAVQEAQQHHEHQLRLVQFGGRYRLQAGREEPPEQPPAGDGQWGLGPYQDYSAFLSTSAHVGLELAADNIERRNSQSFRSLDFLRHGLPLLCTDNLPIAALIRQYRAGWVVQEPGQLPELLAALIRQPEQWSTLSANATRLVREQLDPDRAIAPFLDWLRSPDRAPRLPGYGLADQTPAVIGIPPLAKRLARRYHLARRVALARVFNRRPRADAECVLMLSRGDLFPSDHGAAVKIVETARGLSRSGQEVVLVTDARDHYWVFRNGERHSQPIPAWLRLLSRPLPLVKLDHYTRDIPESNAFLYLPLSDRSFFWRTLYVASRHGARVLHAEFPAYAEPCLAVGAVLGRPVVMVEHNVEYARMREQVPELTQDQFQRLKAIEVGLANRCDAVVCVSDNDRRMLAADGVHAGLLSTIPHGIDLEGFDRATAGNLRSELNIPPAAPLIAYHGTFSYPPNRQALQALSSEILPRLRRAGVDAHVLAVGAQPPSGLDAAIHCTGSVENVAPWLKAADLALVPLLEGGGTRMKIIDYFAAGLPVVSTSKGIEGIPVTDGVEALVRDDWDALAAAAIEVMEQPEQAAQLRTGGRAIAEQLDWTAIAARYLALYQKIARRG